MFSANFELLPAYSNCTEAATFILNLVHFPLNLRGMVIALVGASRGSTERFQLSDRELARRLALEGNLEAKRKQIQRDREAIIRWEEKTDLSLIICLPGGMRGEKRFATEYQLPLLEVVQKTVEGARGLSEWETERERAMMRAAHSALLTLEKRPPVIDRFRRARQRKDPEALILRDLRIAATAVSRARDRLMATGNNISNIAGAAIESLRLETDRLFGELKAGNTKTGIDSKQRVSGKDRDDFVPVPYEESLPRNIRAFEPNALDIRAFDRITERLQAKDRLDS